MRALTLALAAGLWWGGAAQAAKQLPWKPDYDWTALNKAYRVVVEFDVGDVNTPVGQRAVWATVYLIEDRLGGGYNLRGLSYKTGTASFTSTSRRRHLPPERWAEIRRLAGVTGLRAED